MHFFRRKYTTYQRFYYICIVNQKQNVSKTLKSKRYEKDEFSKVCTVLVITFVASLQLLLLK